MKIAFHRAYIGIYIKYYLKQHPLCCQPIFPTLKTNIQFGLEVWPSWFTFLLIDIVPKLSIRILSLICLYHVSTCFGGIIDIVLQKWLWFLLVFTIFFCEHTNQVTDRVKEVVTRNQYLIRGADVVLLKTKLNTTEATFRFYKKKHILYFWTI